MTLLYRLAGLIDPQRKRLYRAEDEAFADDYFDRAFTDDAEVQAYVDRVLLLCDLSDVLTITVMPSRKHKMAWAYPALGEIYIPKGYQARQIVLHEMAHVITKRERPKERAHGATFAAVYLAMTRVIEGRYAAERLQRCYDKHRVKVAHEALPDLKAALL